MTKTGETEREETDYLLGFLADLGEDSRATADLAEVLRLCRNRGGRPLKEAVNDALKEVAMARGVCRGTVHHHCTRHIGFTGEGSIDRFVELARKLLKE